MTTFNIKRGGFWQNGKLHTADHVDPKLRTVDFDDAERKRVDPDGSHLQSSAEAKLEADKLAVEAELASKRAAALADIDAKHIADLKAKAKKDGAK